MAGGRGRWPGRLGQLPLPRHDGVGDTGIGIEAAKQAIIFEEFYQIGNSARDFTSGAGVGLAIVRRLVDILGHRIQVRSIEGRGSLFTVTVQAA